MGIIDVDYHLIGQGIQCAIVFDMALQNVLQRCADKEILLTKAQILPHLQKVRHMTVDGLRLFEDITFADSMGHTFYALPDFSYIIDDGKTTTLYGEAYWVRDGRMEQITRENDRMKL